MTVSRIVLTAVLVATSALAVPPSLRLAAPIHKAPTAPRQQTGEITVVLRLGDAPLAAVNEGAKRGATPFMSASAQRTHTSRLANNQQAIAALIASTGAREVARLQKALNAVIVKVDASKVQQLAAIPGVISARPIGAYELHLADTVPYIGATVAHARGVNGRGVRVAIIDSGIDYTHRALGGAGTDAAYEAAWGTSPSDPRNTTTDGLFPTAKVVAGYDFVGEAWPDGPVAPDADPIDLEGHGTHVADIIAGTAGVAPGASLVAIKACSAVASACNGVALIQAMEFALDPNGDGDISDAVDVINMSLGSSYGQEQDDLSEASNNAAKLGVVVVASAGNSGDRPYITGSPASAPEVISVAQTEVPTAKRFPLVVSAPASIAGSYANTEVLDWAPLGTGFSGSIAYVGRGCNADTYLASPAGKIALIDRGACNVSEKVRRASDAGAIGVLIGLVAAGDAVGFSNGGQCPVPADGTCKAALVITQPVSAAIKANAAAPVVVSVSASNFVSLERSIVGSSARGPAYSTDAIKPDIGAPGASISAVAGTGTGTEAFGGTSGAAPMVTGAAALLVQAFPNRTPRQIKAMLMNSAETAIFTNPATLPGELAPITRIGAGEVRVDKALDLGVIVQHRRSGSGSLSFGAVSPTSWQVREEQLELTNFTSQPRFFRIASTFRYANDASGAAVVDVQPSVVVGPRSSRIVTARLTIDPWKLPVWGLNGGSLGGNGALLQTVEFDGYLTFTDQSRPAQSLHLPWHVLPHRAANVHAQERVRLNRAGTGSANLSNRGSIEGVVEVFALTGVSSRIPRNQQPQPGDNFALIDLRAVGVRFDVDVVQFGIATSGTRSHPNYPAGFQVDLDVNRDGVLDFSVFNSEVGAFASTGQNAVFVQALNPDGTPNGDAAAYFYADADLNSGNMIFTVPLEAVGLTPEAQFDFSVLAYDNYFTGNVTDSIAPMTHTLATPKYAASGLPVDGIPAWGSAQLAVSAVTGGATASPSQTGLLLLYRDAPARNESDKVIVEP